MNEIASMEAWLRMIRNIAFGGVIFFCLVGLDILMGGRAIGILGKTFNKRFDLDKIVMMGLSGFRDGTEKKLMNVDEVMQQRRARIFVGVMLLIPAFLLATLVLTRS